MNNMQRSIIDPLVRSFRRLKHEQLENLKWHLANNTPIFCGPGSQQDYYNDAGDL